MCIPLGEGTAHEHRSSDVMSNRNKIRKLVLALLRLLEECRQGGCGRRLPPGLEGQIAAGIA